MENRFGFTMPRIGELPPAPDGKRALYWDERVRELALRVTASGAKSFYGVRWYKGSAEWLRLGAFPGMNVDHARKLTQDFVAALNRGEDPSAQRRAARAESTFGELFSWWLESHAKSRLSPSYIEDCEKVLRIHLQPLSKKQASSITRSEVRALHNRIGAEHPYQSNRVLALVRSIFNKAIADDRCKCANPTIGIKPFDEASRERRLLPGEIPGFLEAVAAEPNGDIRDFVQLALFTGARKENVLAIRWDQVDLGGGTWAIPYTKNGLPQVIPLEAPEVEILTRRQVAADEGEAWVFPGRGASGHLADPKAGWKRILDRAGLKDLRIHDLRRTLGSYMADTGAPLNIVGKALNHLSPAATQIYARLTLDPVRQAKRKAQQAMMGNGDRDHA